MTVQAHMGVTISVAINSCEYAHSRCHLVVFLPSSPFQAFVSHLLDPTFSVNRVSGVSDHWRLLITSWCPCHRLHIPFRDILVSKIMSPSCPLACVHFPVQKDPWNPPIRHRVYIFKSAVLEKSILASITCEIYCFHQLILIGYLYVYVILQNNFQQNVNHLFFSPLSYRLNAW